MSKLPTQFAPAERAIEQQIKRDTDFFVKASLINAMLDAIPEMILILNAQRQAVFANEACLQVLDMRNRHEAIGHRPGELIGCVHATETEGGCGTTEFCRTCGAVKAILSSNKGVASTQECRISLRSGDAIDLQASAKPLDVNDQRFSIFTLKDIGSEKRRRALERIFFHDVLNTAGVVSMCAEILKRDPDEAEGLIDDLDRCAQRLINEIRSQQDLMAAENGELLAKPKAIGVTSFLFDLAKQYERHSVAAERHISIAETAETLMLMSDPTLLGRVVGNMIKNALEAAQPGDTVTVSCVSADETITFAVHNPTYMPRDVQLQIFNRSFSTKGAGRGLGTYSMKLLSERYLNGCVRFESTPEKGTIFYATYPCEWLVPFQPLPRN